MAKYSITCPNCGVENFSDARLCRNCGHELPKPNKQSVGTMQFVTNHKRPIGLALVALIVGLLVVGSMFRHNNTFDFHSSQLQPFEMKIFNQNGKQVKKTYFTYKTIKKRGHVYHAKAVFLSKKQTGTLTSNHITKYYQTKPNYKMTFDMNKDRSQIQMPDGTLTLDKFDGRRLSGHPRHISGCGIKKGFTYTFRMIQAETPE